MLNERQRELYKLILENSKKQITTTQQDIVKSIKGYEWLEKGHDHCPAIWNDVNKINFSDEVDHIIIIDNFTYYIPRTKEQALEFANKQFTDGKKKMARYSNVVKKLKRNGQFEFDEEFKSLSVIESLLNEN